MRRPALSLLFVFPVLAMALAVSPAAGASAQVPSRIPNVGLMHVTRLNWAGYADDNRGGHTYTSVAAHWVQPLVRCPATGTAGAAFAVGIDGFSSNTEEQDGTMADCNNGVATYFTWWEVFPGLTLVGRAVRPGDAIFAQVNFNTATGDYGFEVSDSTHPANSFATDQACAAGPACLNSSAEWVTETTTGPGGTLCLPDFGLWHVTGTSVFSPPVAGTIATFPDDEITMVNALQHTLARPGALAGGPPAGNAFTVHWLRCS
jgi:hypothetical protein